MADIDGPYGVLLDSQQNMDFNWPEGKLHFWENDEAS
jgi:hypothetical protein